MNNEPVQSSSNEAPSSNRIQIILAVIGLIGAALSLIVPRLLPDPNTKLSLEATQTVEARTVAQTATVSAATAVSINWTPTSAATPPPTDPPSPTPLPTDTPTATVTPSPPPTGTFTPLPTATVTPTPSPLPGPAARITNLVNGDTVAQYITVQGEYRADVSDTLWLFVLAPNKLYYPVSMAPCQGQSIPKKNGQWEIRTGVGVADSGGEFELVLTSANQEADQFIIASLENGCQASTGFAGMAALPPGVTEIERLKVTRLPVVELADGYGPAPAIPDAGLPGQVTVDPFAEGNKVNQEQFIGGTVSGVGTARVWVLVYTFYGRWYPQSINPCQGNHTEQSEGQWRAKVIVGSADDRDNGKPFEVVVVAANEAANTYLDQRQKDWCWNNHYPGLLTIDLPPGLSEKYRMRVVR